MKIIFEPNNHDEVLKITDFIKTLNTDSKLKLEVKNSSAVKKQSTASQEIKNISKKYGSFSQVCKDLIQCATQEDLDAIYKTAEQSVIATKGFLSTDREMLHFLYLDHSKTFKQLDYVSTVKYAIASKLVSDKVIRSLKYIDTKCRDMSIIEIKQLKLRLQGADFSTYEKNALLDRVSSIEKSLYKNRPDTNSLIGILRSVNLCNNKLALEELEKDTKHLCSTSKEYEALVNAMIKCRDAELNADIKPNNVLNALIRYNSDNGLTVGHKFNQISVNSPYFFEKIADIQALCKNLTADTAEQKDQATLMFLTQQLVSAHQQHSDAATMEDLQKQDKQARIEKIKKEII